MVTAPDEEYVVARRVLLDALTALGKHRGAVVVAGAQAIYLRAGEGSLPIADFTTDADLTLDPALLADSPQLEALLEAADFEHVERNGALEPGAWETSATLRGVEVKIPLDLIVPAGSSAGGRGARLGPHGKRAARRSAGLEAALVDNEPIEIGALEPNDSRSFRARVAGLPALLIAKSYKIDDRVEADNRDRLFDKDAADVIRIMEATRPTEMAAKLVELRDHTEAGPSTRLGIAHFERLFGRRNGEGIEMAVRALREAMPEARVRAVCLAYTAGVIERLG